MRSPKGWMAWLMAVVIGIFVLGSPPKASASFVLAAQEDGGVISTVLTLPSFTPVTFSATFGDYDFTFFSAVATNNAGGSNLLSTTTAITATDAGTHTLSLFVSNQDYTLPLGPNLTLTTGMGGTYGSEPGFTGGATFQAWVDNGNGLLNIPGTFSNGLQVAIPASGNAVTFSTGADPVGTFTRGAGPYSLTTQTTFTTTGEGDVNYSNHADVRQIQISTPEPEMPLIMLIVGLLGLFLGVRWQKS